MSRISIHPGVNSWALFLIAVAVSVSIAWFYSRAFRSLRPGQWWRLYGLRMSAVAIVLTLLVRPVLTHQSTSQDQRSIMFLVDRSASMGIRDDAAGATRLQQGTDRIQQWRSALRNDFQTRVMAFADVTEPLSSDEQLGQLLPRGEATSLSRALQAATKLDSARDLEAIFLVSDGIHNAAGDPRAVAGQLGVPVFAVGTGEALRERSTYRDIFVTGVDVPDPLSLGNPARITGYVDAGR